MTQVKYPLPTFLKGICTPQVYRNWLSKKAATHYKRDKRRGHTGITYEAYKIAIHQAVLDGGQFDAYTGRPLEWRLILTYNNELARKGGREHKKKFADLPTVDHVGGGMGPTKFKICSWRVNDSKSDLDLPEFLELCRAVLDFHESKPLSENA
jgi:hypothetical protein